MKKLTKFALRQPRTLHRQFFHLRGVALQMLPNDGVQAQTIKALTESRLQVLSV